MLTVYLEPIPSSEKTKTQLSSFEYIELFRNFPDTVTAHIVVDKDSYWLLSRQTFRYTENVDGKFLNKEEIATCLIRLDEEIHETLFKLKRL